MSVSEVVGQIAPRMGDVTIARGFPVTPAGLGLRGNSTPVRVVVGGPDFESVKEWAELLQAEAETIPGLVNPEIDFDQNLPQLDVTIDRARADDLGISVETIAGTLQTLLASREVTGFVSRGREYPVILQAQDDDRNTPSDIDNIFVRAGDGETLVPLGAWSICERMPPPPACDALIACRPFSFPGLWNPARSLVPCLTRSKRPRGISYRSRPSWGTRVSRVLSRTRRRASALFLPCRC